MPTFSGLGKKYGELNVALLPVQFGVSWLALLLCSCPLRSPASSARRGWCSKRGVHTGWVHGDVETLVLPWRHNGSTSIEMPAPGTLSLGPSLSDATSNSLPITLTPLLCAWSLSTSASTPLPEFRLPLPCLPGPTKEFPN